MAVGSAVGADTDLGFLVSAAGFEWSLMIAVTMGFGEPFGRLAALAARAVREMTGLETVVLDGTHFAASGLPHPHHLKLRIFDHVDDDAVLYFDSDIVCLKPWDPTRFARPDALVVVTDIPHGGTIRACQDWNIPIREFFNAGFMILNRRCHRDWLRETERLIKANPKVSAFQSTDQTALNVTRCRFGLKLELIDRRYNWLAFGRGSLCYQVPVFMAHTLVQENKAANIDFFEGRYQPPFNWHIEIDEAEMARLKNETLCIKGGPWEKPLRLNSDGTIGLPPYPGGGRHWFVHTKSGSRRLAIASEEEILREFIPVSEGVWESVQELLPEPDRASVQPN